jgi:hypothetical protein
VRNWLRYPACLLTFASLGGCSSLNPIGSLEQKALYYPTHQIQVTPQQIGLSYEDVYITAHDKVRLHGWFIRNLNAKYTLIFFHGNGGNISHRLDKIETFYKEGLNIFIIDYRGYGKSEGTPSEQGLYSDALAAYDYLDQRTDVDSNKFIVYGESLGAAVAVDLATKGKVAGLIMDSAFTSVPEMAKAKSVWVPGFLISTKMDSLSKIKRINVPKLFIHSPNDEIIPYYMGEKLYGAAVAPKGFLKIKGRHNEGFLVSKQLYAQGIARFLKELGVVKQ